VDFKTQKQMILRVYSCKAVVLKYLHIHIPCTHILSVSLFLMIRIFWTCPIVDTMLIAFF